MGWEINPHGKNGIYWKTLPPRVDRPFTEFRTFRTFHRISHVSQFFALFRAFLQQDKKPINTLACLLCRMKIHDPFDVGIALSRTKHIFYFFRIITKKIEVSRNFPHLEKPGFFTLKYLKQFRTFRKSVTSTLTPWRVFSLQNCSHFFGNDTVNFGIAFTHAFPQLPLETKI